VWELDVNDFLRLLDGIDHDLEAIKNQNAG
jgi:hypothetical protein